MSTFSGLNTAHTALVAARQGLDVVGQNIGNVNTVGYTRQRASLSAIGSPAQTGPLFGPAKVGQGVAVDGISRLGNVHLDARVRTTAAASGYWGTRASSLSTLQTSLHEPGANGISAALRTVWSGWQAMANHPGEAATGAALLEQSGALVTQIAGAYRDVDTQWTQLRAEVGDLADELNDAAKQVAELNGLIRSTLAGGGSANELLDRRNNLTTTIATLTGATVRNLPDGTADVLVGGNALVTGDRFHTVAVSGSSTMIGAAGAPVKLEWTDRPDVPVGVEGGEIAGALSMLAPAAADGTGGSLAEAAADYNEFATYLADKVNTVHRGGATKAGVTNLDFFGVDATKPAALGLSIIPTDVTGIAAGTPGAGGLSGAVADAISQLGGGPDSPDKKWSAIVTGIGTATKAGLRQSVLSNLSTTAAVNNQLASSAVDLDEENVNMLTFQTAYQGAARVMTAVDEMLDTLINRTGIVGR